MTGQHAADSAPVVVVLPAEIDLTNADQVYDRLDAALGSGAPRASVVIADLTATAFCDVATVRRLVMIHARARARGILFRLVIPPGAMPRRLLVLLGVDDVLAVYASVDEARVLLPPQARDPLSGPRQSLLIQLLLATASSESSWSQRFTGHPETGAPGITGACPRRASRYARSQRDEIRVILSN